MRRRRVGDLAPTPGDGRLDRKRTKPTGSGSSGPCTCAEPRRARLLGSCVGCGPGVVAGATGLTKTYGVGEAAVTALDDVTVGLERGRRRQLPGMVTIVAIATTLFGTVLGTFLRVGLGIARQRGLRSQGLEVLAVPWATIMTVLITSVGASPSDRRQPVATTHKPPTVTPKGSVFGRRRHRHTNSRVYVGLSLQ
jgi:hypothetical protein